MQNVLLSASSAPAMASFAPLPGSFACIKALLLSPLSWLRAEPLVLARVTCASSERGVVELHGPRPAPSHAAMTLLATSEHRYNREHRKDEPLITPTLRSVGSGMADISCKTSAPIHGFQEEIVFKILPNTHTVN